MTDSGERGRYVPMQRGSVRIERPQRLSFDISSLSVTGLVLICELGDPVPENVRPTMTMTMTQYLRISDESMIRLDMDRGVASSRHGYGRAVSWKRSAADVIAEVLTPAPNSGKPAAGMTRIVIFGRLAVCVVSV